MFSELKDLFRSIVYFQNDTIIKLIGACLKSLLMQKKGKADTVKILIANLSWFVWHEPRTVFMVGE